MTDDTDDSTEREPDGYLLLHINPDQRFGRDGMYGFGPFPVTPENADRLEALAAVTRCGCKVTAIPIYLPVGVRLGMTMDLVPVPKPDAEQVH